MSRKWLTVVVLFAGITIVSFLFLDRVLHFSAIDFLRGSLSHPGPLAALAIVGLLAVDIFLPVPSTVVMVLSGTLFGTGVGSALSLLGSIIGNLTGFEMMRRYGPAFCSRFVKESDLAKMTPLFEEYGALAVILSRPLPIMMETLSFVAGLMRMSRHRFILSSLAGTLPISVLYAYAGTSSIESRTVVPALFMLLCIPALGWYALHRLKRSR